MGYETGQFGKNHLGDLNRFLPCAHGFDEFFGYLDRLDALPDPYWFDYPQDWIDKTGPRNLIHCWTTDTNDTTSMPQWGPVGKGRLKMRGRSRILHILGMPNWQKGRPAKYDMKPSDEVLLQHTNGFMDKAKKDDKPFFIWHNTTRMHVFTYISPKYQAMMNYDTNYNLEEAGMAQVDDCIGSFCSISRTLARQTT